MNPTLLLALVFQGLVSAAPVAQARQDSVEFELIPEERDLEGLDPAALCPMEICEARVTIQDTPNGVALLFTLDEEAGADEIRRKVRSVAFAHNLDQMTSLDQDEAPDEEAEVAPDEPSGLEQPGTQGVPSPEEPEVEDPAGEPVGSPADHKSLCDSPVTEVRTVALTEPMPRGARLVLVPLHPEELAWMRFEVRRNVTKQASPGCPESLEVRPMERGPGPQ